MTAADDLDRRAASDPRLERYRVAPGGPDALARIPDGWHLSDAITRLLVDGGWWPGELTPHDHGPAFVPGLLAPGADTGGAGDTVRWMAIGTVFERDTFFTPLLPRPRPTAPLLGFSSQALWVSLAFPTEEAMLDAFVVTYDELGVDELGEVNPFFVEWVTGPPDHDVEPADQAAADEAHRRIVALSAGWASDHPCWAPDVMPILTDDPWPDRAVAAALGRPHPA